MALWLELQQSVQQRKSNGCCEAARGVGELDESTDVQLDATGLDQ